MALNTVHSGLHIASRTTLEDTHLTDITSRPRKLWSSSTLHVRRVWWLVRDKAICGGRLLLIGSTPKLSLCRISDSRPNALDSSEAAQLQSAILAGPAEWRDATCKGPGEMGAPLASLSRPALACSGGCEEPRKARLRHRTAFHSQESSVWFAAQSVTLDGEGEGGM